MQNSGHKGRSLLSTSMKEQGDSPMVQIDSNLHYFTQYIKIQELSAHLSHQLAATRERQEGITAHIGRLAVRSEQLRDPVRLCPPDRKKKPRRAADDIDKEHVCMGEDCDRRYGSVASLRIHLKSKHPELYEAKKRGRAGGQ